MKSNRIDRRLYPAPSLDLESNIKDYKDSDSISFRSLSLDPTTGLHYFNTLINHRSNKRSLNSIINHENGLIINGYLFDEQLFQPTRTSYGIDYTNATQDLNKFLEGHSASSINSHLDAHLFKLCFIITLSEWHVDKELLLEYYPHDDDNEKNEGNILQEISHYKRFCFPELNSKQNNGGQMLNDRSTYIFTRTLSNGEVEYGYCRRLTKECNQITKFPIVICIVSTYSYFKLYDAILNELATAYLSNELECNSLIQSFYSKPLPVPAVNSSGITCILNDRRIFFYICPRDDRLNHDYFSTLLSCLSSTQIVYLFESMLRSKRILVFSQYSSKLTKSCLALSSLMYPFIWPYSFVSLMPSSWLHDLLDSPCPYIYGCLYETIEQLPTILDNDTICVDLDLGTVDGCSDMKYILPLNLRQTLESSLEYLTRFRLVKSNSTFINIAVSEACLYVFTELLHRLPDFFHREKLVMKNTSVDSKSLKRHDSGVDLQSVVSEDISQTTTNDNRLGYEFRSEEFLSVQPMKSYVLFLKEFIHGMIFLKFLDDYQGNDVFSLFSQRLNERRQTTLEELTINPSIKFRQTFDLLEKQIKQASKPTNPTFSKFLKKIFE